jgi:uncharacterized protein (DUF433 family)/DNA-binding XRE family transcriptional regulator
MTQRELAEKTGLTQPALSAIEHGTEPLGLARAVRIAEVLGVHYRDILASKVSEVNTSVPAHHWNRYTTQQSNIVEALIEKTPDILGGSARIMRTRIAVWAIENYRRLGWTEEEILQNYPTLRPVDLQAAWRYVKSNRTEINREIDENEIA